MSAPLVSIIILSYNYARFMGQAIQSVLDQTYSNLELIIIDDASTDNSLEVIRSFADPRITVIERTTNGGSCRSYNQAYEICRGKYLGSLDADDYFMPNKLARQVAFMEEHPEIDVTGTFIYQVTEKDEIQEGLYSQIGNQEYDLDLIDNWAIIDYISHSSALIRKTSHDRLGGLTPELEYMPDYELWLRGFVRGMRFRVLPEQLTCYRAHQSNTTNNVKRKKLLLQFTFLYCTHLAPYLIRIYRLDLIEKCFSILLNEFFPEAPIWVRRHFLQKLADFPLYPKEPQPFFEAFCQHLHPELWQFFNYKLPGVESQFNTTENLTGAFHQAEKTPGLIIVDDFFPNLISSFRVQEFNYYLEKLKCTIYSISPDFERDREEYARLYPQYKERIRPYKPGQKVDGSFLYTVFLNNIFSQLPLIESQKLPFCFTLYPGGGFLLNNLKSDYKLQKVLNSPYFRKVIVTQPVTLDYLIFNKFCPKEKIEFIYGGVLPTQYYEENLVPRRVYGKNKSILDICFVAMKYTPLGVDKGYDIFVKVAKKLVMFSPYIRFHVVGPFDRDDIDVTGLGDKITFYGEQLTAFFPSFYAQMDLILSPNVPNKLDEGAFDGFPTASCFEAGLNGVAVFCTDELKNNFFFEDGKDLVIISPDPDEIVRKIMSYYGEPEKLAALAQNGRVRFQELGSLENNLSPRLKILSTYI